MNQKVCGEAEHSTERQYMETQSGGVERSSGATVFRDCYNLLRGFSLYRFFAFFVLIAKAHTVQPVCVASEVFRFRLSYSIHGQFSEFAAFSTICTEESCSGDDGGGQQQQHQNNENCMSRVLKWKKAKPGLCVYAAIEDITLKSSSNLIY